MVDEAEVNVLFEVCLAICTIFDQQRIRLFGLKFCVDRRENVSWDDVCSEQVELPCTRDDRFKPT